jgi:hypothetical protein
MKAQSSNITRRPFSPANSKLNSFFVWRLQRILIWVAESVWEAVQHSLTWFSSRSVSRHWQENRHTFTGVFSASHAKESCLLLRNCQRQRDLLYLSGIYPHPVALKIVDQISQLLWKRVEWNCFWQEIALIDAIRSTLDCNFITRNLLKIRYLRIMKGEGIFSS